MGPAFFSVLLIFSPYLPSFLLCLLSAARVNHVLCMTNQTSQNTLAIGDSFHLLPHFCSTATFTILMWYLHGFYDLGLFPSAKK